MVRLNDADVKVGRSSSVLWMPDNLDHLHRDAVRSVQAKLPNANFQSESFLKNISDQRRECPNTFQI